ncbi:putative transcriptional regulatory protein C1F7.11c 4 [Colletotrichum chlorophyti]|uniref:Putative transcriptional regulatory protein C1F7.11c 4 n=1 Tax=Colletotrichum chlorophyti TaxID=708187 RepID=A0A1Q8RN00_9PEZI|nr:putative transcriptional regulatory protein C1F7.11c 4 [Colletotrichum chlorophyti]
MTRRTISQLQKRLERLEGSSASQNPTSAVAKSLPASSDPLGFAPVLPTSGRAENTIGPVGTGSSESSWSSAESAPEGLPQPTVHVSNNENETVYGPSSNISFLQQVTLATDPRNPNGHGPATPGCKPDDSTPTVLGFSTTQPRAPEPLPESVMLPERWLADALTQSFWEFVHPVFPILHRPSFIASYQELWRPAQDRGRKRCFKDVVFHATLSIVLALGAQRTDQVSATEQADLAGRFYEQSVKIAPVDTLDHSSLQVVQLLLLRGVFLHYTQYADRCWNTTGLALRVAQGLGLHAQTERTTAINQLRREMRRRVWHCCLTLDRLTATTFGRPVLISRSYSVPAPAAIDDEYLSEATEGVQPPDRPSYLVFFNESLALFDVLNGILAKFYSDGDYALERRAESLNDMLQLSSKLDDLSSTFPEYLREDVDLTALDEELRGCLQMQSNILKSRVLWIRLLLLRPLLLAEARQGSRTREMIPGSSTLRESLAHSANTLCVATAHEVLKEMYEKLGSVRQNSPWHVLLFTFAAASTLVVATLCPKLHVSFETEPGKTSWDRALRIFDFHKTHVASADKGIEVLQRLRASVVAVLRRETPAGSASTEPRPEQGDSLLPFSSVPGLSQTPLAQDLTDFFDSDLLNESWFNMQGIDLSNWSTFQ